MLINKSPWHLKLFTHKMPSYIMLIRKAVIHLNLFFTLQLCRDGQIGVFTCGSPSLSAATEAAVLEANKDHSEDAISFKHYYENF